ncbi:hypothetical protein KXW37_010006 [Aspergillus fumigatus]|nr:hypothetical protein KXW37_010006 [Aspergillus fumigatus]
MIFSTILALTLWGSANAATLGRRFSNGDFATGETDPNVSSGCTYWANSIKSTDTCAALESYYGITIAQLVSWNPSLSASDCVLTVGWSYCVEAPAVKTTRKTTMTTATTKTTTNVVTTTTPTTTTITGGVPSPTQSGLTTSCNAFYKVQPGDYCYQIMTTYGNFSLDQFYEWNPTVKSDCSGLQAGYYVCVGVAGSDTAPTTITAAPTTTTATTTSSSYSPQQTGITKECNKYYFVQKDDSCAGIAIKYSISVTDFYNWNPAVGTSTTTEKSTTTTAATSAGPSPTQAGITADCETYYQAVSGDSCWSIVNEKYTYLTSDEFYTWNPAVGSSCANLQGGYYYCVATKTVHPMPNTTSTCKTWHLVASGDSCWSIEQQYSITATQFGTWNPYVGSSCASLWLGYYVCVGI